MAAALLSAVTTAAAQTIPYNPSAAAPRPTGRGRGRGPAMSPQQASPIDMTGYWVSVVTEDWKFRMVTPVKGNYSGVPLNPEGHKVAETWDPAKDEASGNQCRSYGAAGLMRDPGRLHITWENDKTLRIDTDSGNQTRLFHFGGSDSEAGAPSLQGYSEAKWEPAAAGRGQKAKRRRSQSGNHAHAARLSPQERRSLQRERGTHGILRPHQRPKRRMARSNNRSERSSISEFALHHQHPLQEGSRRKQVDADPLFRKVSGVGALGLSGWPAAASNYEKPLWGRASALRPAFWPARNFTSALGAVFQWCSHARLARARKVMKTHGSRPGAVFPIFSRVRLIGNHEKPFDPSECSWWEHTENHSRGMRKASRRRTPATRSSVITS